LLSGRLGDIPITLARPDGVRILLVDDDQLVRDTQTKQPREFGHKRVATSRGRDAAAPGNSGAACRSDLRMRKAATRRTRSAPVTTVPEPV